MLSHIYGEAEEQKAEKILIFAKSGNFRPRQRYIGSPGKQPRIIDGFGFLSNLKYSKDRSLIKMQYIGKEIFQERLSRSHPGHPGQEEKKCKSQTQDSLSHSVIT